MTPEMQFDWKLFYGYKADQNMNVNTEKLCYQFYLYV